MTLAPAVTRAAVCGTTEGRALVDAAMGNRPAEATRRLEREFCAGCPIWRDCLHDAMASGEHGPWGGTGRRVRTRAGAPGYVHANMANVVHPGLRNEKTTAPAERAPSRRVQLVNSLGVTPIDVQRWAVDQGLIPHVMRGFPPLPLVEAYAAAHHITAA